MERFCWQRQPPKRRLWRHLHCTPNWLYFFIRISQVSPCPIDIPSLVPTNDPSVHGGFPPLIAGEEGEAGEVISLDLAADELCWFTYWKRWFSIAFCMFSRGYDINDMGNCWHIEQEHEVHSYACKMQYLADCHPFKKLEQLALVRFGA